MAGGLSAEGGFESDLLYRPPALVVSLLDVHWLDRDWPIWLHYNANFRILHVIDNVVVFGDEVGRVSEGQSRIAHTPPMLLST